MFDPVEEARAKEQKRAGERAVRESTQSLAQALEGGDATPKGASNPRLEEADRKANEKVPTNWQWS